MNVNSVGLSSDSTNDGQSMQQTNKTFPTMLKLISGALIGGVNYEEIYMDSDLDDESNNMAEHQNTNIHKIPTLNEAARKVARLKNRELDEK
jgi:hypothetical protein